LLHPFTGLDHLLAMLAVGLWAAQAPRRIWVAPVAFANLMLVGALTQWPATLSVLIKTALLYTIMVTGAIWEKVVFGRYLFAPAFYWEDVFSMLVLALHTAYLAMVLLNLGTPREQLILALAAYATYVINAGQFIWKLRMARLEAPAKDTMAAA
jgi:2-vinyl bacteriochlorophyllide hydratase